MAKTIKTILSAVMVITVNFIASSQTYFGYQPREKEAYVDYNQVNKDLNDAIQKKIKEREELKEYYNDLYYESKNTIESSTQLSNNSTVNSKILSMQLSALSRLNGINLAMQNGTSNISYYESQINSLINNFKSANQIFLNIALYYDGKIREFKNSSEKDLFEKYFSESVNSVKDFSFVSYETTFSLNELVYPDCTIKNLYHFISTSSEGKYDTYKNAWIEKQISIQKNIENEREEREKKYQGMVNARRELFTNRTTFINSLSKEDIEKYKKNERKHIIESLKNLKKQNAIPKNTDIKKEVDYWLRLENYKHEFFLLDKTSYKEPLDYPIPRCILGILYNMYRK
jgi:hypothetical protein